MGKENHSDTPPVGKGKICAIDVHEDDTRWGVGATHKGLPERAKYKLRNTGKDLWEQQREWTR